MSNNIINLRMRKMNSQLATKQNVENGAILEKVMLGTDLSSLSPVEKVTHIKNICESLGLNPVTTPIKLMKFNGKEIPYFAKEATEQLRVLKKISIKIIESKIIDDLYIVIAEAHTPDGRIDSSTGAISISGLKGEAKANAIMKAETKAKRRVTLSICGLGFNDESEMDFARNDTRQNVIQKPVQQLQNKVEVEQANDDLMSDFDDFMVAIEKCENEDQLRSVFSEIKKLNFRSHPELLSKLVNAKDEKKKSLILKEFNDEIDLDTGEVI